MEESPLSSHDGRTLTQKVDHLAGRINTLEQGYSVLRDDVTELKRVGKRTRKDLKPLKDFVTTQLAEEKRRDDRANHILAWAVTSGVGLIVSVALKIFEIIHG